MAKTKEEYTIKLQARGTGKTLSLLNDLLKIKEDLREQEGHFAREVEPSEDTINKYMICLNTEKKIDKIIDKINRGIYGKD